jgi:hypothetical protein
MSNPLSLSQLKQLFEEGMNYAKKKYSSLFYDRQDELCNYQVALSNTKKDLSEFMNVIWFSNNTFANSFKEPKPIDQDKLLTKTKVQFGIGNIEWYFYYGLTKSYGFNLNFIKMEIVPPEIVEKYNLDPSQCVAWIVLGGYGRIGGSTWNSILPEWIQMNYITEGNSFDTFVLEGNGNSIVAQLGTVKPMEFNINLDYKDLSMNDHKLNIVLSANLPPLPNFKNACECGYSLGTLYYSYTDMNVNLTVNSNPVENGKGWMDHQLLKSGLPNSNYIQALETVLGMFGKNKSGGWLWFSIQDYVDNVQYMFVHLFNKDGELANDINVGDEISLDTLNVYYQGQTLFFPENDKFSSKQTKIILTEKNVKGPEGIFLPSKYSIILPSGKKTVFQIATFPNIYPIAHCPYETPSYLYDENGTVIGGGIIEANWYLSNSQYANRLIEQAVADPSKYNLIYNGIAKPQNGWQKTFAVLYLLLPIFILCLLLYFIFYKKDERMVRLILSLFVLFLMIMIL